MTENDDLRPEPEFAAPATPQPPVGTDDNGPQYGQPVPPTQTTKGRNRGAVILASVLGLALIGTGAVFALPLLSPVHRPSEALPAASAMYIEANLEPGVDQLTAAAALLEKVPEAKNAQGEQMRLDRGGSAKEQLFNLLLRDVLGMGIEYADVEPWIGDRVGIGVLGGSTGLDTPTPAVAFAVKDSAAAMRSLPQILAQSSSLSRMTATPVGDRFVVLTTTSSAPLFTKALHEGTLDQSASFKRMAPSMDKDKIVSFYGDATKALKLVADVTDLATPVPEAGGVSAGVLNLTTEYAEFKVDGVDGQKVDFETGAYELAGAVGGNPYAVVSISDTLPMFNTLWENLPSDQKSAATDVAQSLGLAVPGDLGTLLGDRTALAVFDGNTVGLVTQGAKSSETQRLWADLDTTMAAATGTTPLKTATEGDRVAVTFSQAGDPAIEPSELLRGSQASSASLFNRAVAAGPATVVVFVDTSSFASSGMSIPKLGIGITVVADKDGTSKSVARIVPLG